MREACISGRSTVGIPVFVSHMTTTEPAAGRIEKAGARREHFLVHKRLYQKRLDELAAVSICGCREVFLSNRST